MTDSNTVTPEDKQHTKVISAHLTLDMLQALRDKDPSLYEEIMAQNSSKLTAVGDKRARFANTKQAPYYNRDSATLMQVYVDKLRSSGDSKILVSLTNFYGIKLNTLYQRVRQGLYYLEDFMDTPDKDYAKFLSLCVVKTRRPIGVFIAKRWLNADVKNHELAAKSLIQEIDKHKQTQPAPAKEPAKTVTASPVIEEGEGEIFHDAWISDLEDWLDGNKQESFDQSGLNLTLEDQQLVRDMTLGMLLNVLVTGSRIVVSKRKS